MEQDSSGGPAPAGGAGPLFFYRVADPPGAESPLEPAGRLATLPRPRFSPPAMAKPKKKREIVHLVCSETGERNYTIRKKPGTPKLELKKYCPRVRKHTLHVEKKK